MSLHCDRIARLNPKLNAIVIHDPDLSLQTAKERDAEPAYRPLHGVPVTVKEAFDVRGWKTTANFSPFRNNIAEADAYAVRCLKDAGAVVLGKTNVPTLLADYQTCGPLYTTAKNPYDLARTPGGSTGGGAAALAAGLTLLEIGSDLGGSIRVPAHFCGLFGLKPTENALAHGDGHVPPPTRDGRGFVAMASIGPLARTMADIELGWNALKPPPQRPVRVHTDISRYRVAWFADTSAACCDHATKSALLGLIATLQANGVVTEHRPFDVQWERSACQTWASLLGAMVGQHCPWWMRQALKVPLTYSARGSAHSIASAWRRGLSLDFRHFSRALSCRHELASELAQRFSDYDFIISPVAAGPAFPHNPRHNPVRVDGSPIPYFDFAMPFVVPYNVCGNPVLVVPAGLNSEGLPIGLQIASAPHTEPDLLQFGRLLELLGYTSPTPPSDVLDSIK
ncbi:amidase [Bryobacterales bacterium F-183]|nr:amidase [Bryobacterales bacterium F-183]